MTRRGTSAAPCALSSRFTSSQSIVRVSSNTPSMSHNSARVPSGTASRSAMSMQTCYLARRSAPPIVWHSAAAIAWLRPSRRLRAALLQHTVTCRSRQISIRSRQSPSAAQFQFATDLRGRCGLGWGGPRHALACISGLCSVSQGCAATATEPASFGSRHRESGGRRARLRGRRCRPGSPSQPRPTAPACWEFEAGEQGCRVRRADFSPGGRIRTVRPTCPGWVKRRTHWMQWRAAISARCRPCRSANGWGPNGTRQGGKPWWLLLTVAQQQKLITNDAAVTDWPLRHHAT